MTTTVGYSRLSQESDTSIDRQQRNIREYCDEHDLNLETIYDDGEQASGFETEREAYQELREEIRNGSVNAVVVNDKRRLARDVDEVMRLIPDLRTEGIELHTCQDKQLDLSDPMRAAIEILMAAAAHEEKMSEIEKSIDAIEEKQERGDDLGRPRFGMTYDDSNPPQQVPGDEFDTVMKILKMESKGMSYQQISDATGVSTSTAHRVVNRREWYVEREQLSEQ